MFLCLDNKENNLLEKVKILNRHISFLNKTTTVCSNKVLGFKISACYKNTNFSPDYFSTNKTSQNKQK